MGPVIDSYNYDAFGNVLNSTGTTPNNYLYRGEQFDPSLNPYYLRARFYNTATNRFLSRDPNHGHIGWPSTLHKYAYASADPVDPVDPMIHLRLSIMPLRPSDGDPFWVWRDEAISRR